MPPWTFTSVLCSSGKNQVTLQQYTAQITTNHFAWLPGEKGNLLVRPPSLANNGSRNGPSMFVLAIRKTRKTISHKNQKQRISPQTILSPAESYRQLTLHARETVCKLKQALLTIEALLNNSLYWRKRANTPVESGSWIRSTISKKLM